jgi:hypothetical protein
MRGDGEFRYGDRRLPPWTDEKEGYLPKPAVLKSEDLNLSKKTDADGKKTDADERDLRYSPADFAFRRNMNIYEQNYAIGAGYISQSEFNGIYNEFYTQSQLTSGLILPLLILSVCMGIRFICCSAFAPTGPGVWKPLAAVGGTIYLATLLGLLLAWVLSLAGSKGYRGVVGLLVFGSETQQNADGPKDSFRRDIGVLALVFAGLAILIWCPTENSWKWILFVLGILLVVSGALALIWVLVLCVWRLFQRMPITFGLFLLSIALSILFVCANHEILELGLILIIALPCVFLAPLWVAGLDRLHKYHSELQARIAGNILRLEKNTEQKMVDLITQSDSRISLRENLEKSVENKKEILKFLEKIMEK